MSTGPSEAIEQEIQFLRDQIKTLRRTASAIERQIDHMETRIDDLRKVVQPPPAQNVAKEEL